MMNGDEKSLYQPWFEAEFVADEDAQALDCLGKHVYRQLLQKAWVIKTRPDLPDDDEKLWRLAGCENKKQWLSIADSIRGLFQATVNDQCLPVLRRKRLMRDWEREWERKEKLKEAGRKGGSSKAYSLATAWLQPGPSTVRDGTGRDGTEPDGTSATPSLEKPQNLNDVIPARCKTILGLEPEPEALWKSKLKALSKAFPDSGRIVRAFEQWAEVEKGSTSRYPIGDFLQVATGILNGIIQVERNPELDSLNARLTVLGRQPFAGKNLQVLASLLQDNTADDIVAAFKTMVDESDEYNLQRAVQNFATGGAQAMLLVLRNRREQERQRQLILENSIAEDKRKREELDAAAAIERGKSAGVCESDF